MMKSYFWEKQIGTYFTIYGRNVYAIICRINVQQRSYTQDKQIDYDKDTCKIKHVCLNIIYIGTTLVYLHQILIQSGHRYRYKHTTQKQFYKMKTITS